MNTLMKKLAEEVSEGGIEIFTDTLATAVRLVDDAWQVETENDQVFSARVLLLTPPVPQSLALIDAGKVRLHGTTGPAWNESSTLLVCAVFSGSKAT